MKKTSFRKNYLLMLKTYLQTKVSQKKLLNYQVTKRHHKKGSCQICTSVRNSTMGQNFKRGQKCTKTLLLEQTLLQGDSFARIDCFFIFFSFLINFYLQSLLPSVGNFFLMFILCLLFFYKNFY